MNARRFALRHAIAEALTSPTSQVVHPDQQMLETNTKFVHHMIRITAFNIATALPGPSPPTLRAAAALAEPELAHLLSA